jgi:hypothetical protein
MSGPKELGFGVGASFTANATHEPEFAGQSIGTTDCTYTCVPTSG